MRCVALSLALFLCVPVAGLTQDVLPERFLAITQDADFPGGDLRPIFDTDLSQCDAACRADPDCVGFTFNGRNGACFPKSELGESTAYEGAFSGAFRPTNPVALARLDARLGTLGFLGNTDLTQARDQALGLAQEHYADRFSADQWRLAGDRALTEGNLSGAMRMYGAAITVGDDPRDWIAYAQMLLQIEGGNRQAERNRERDAFYAAINASLRAEPGTQLGAAAAVLAEALERRGRGRDSISAWRLAMREAPTAVRSAALDRALGLYGFRVLDTTVETETDFPRICTTFSEPLAEGGVTYGDYVQTTADGLSVEAEGRQLCLAGVRHGQRYEYTLRAGLTAASGESLRAPVQLRQYVRDREPSVRFAGRAYILPASAGGVLPIVAVNTDLVDLQLYAVSDRNILRTLQDSYFGRPLQDWQVARFAEELGEAVWQGEAEVAQELNRSVTTRLPMGEIMDGLSPGLYALEARVGGAGTGGSSATQWFLVSDLGVSALSGADGVHVVVRSLADLTAHIGVTVALVSESNRILAEAVTDDQGYARFDAGLALGDGASAPAMVTVTDGDQDFAFLSLREAEFDLSDRGVEGREPAGAIDLFLTTDRGAYRAGEEIHVTALARDPSAVALTDLPLTAILIRADGVEYSRTLLSDAGAGGYVFSLPLGADVPRGTWRLAIHADPDAAPLASETVLVEDFLPERLDLTLDLPDGSLSPSDRPTLTMQADYLFGAPAADLTIEGRTALRPSASHPDHPLYRFGRHDAVPDTVFGSLEPVVTGEDGAAITRVQVPELSGLPQPGVLSVTATLSEGSGRPVERQITRPVTPDAPMIGIRPLFDAVLPEAADAQFHVIGTGTEALPVTWTLNRVERRYQWYRQGGNWSWEPITTRTRIATGTAELSGDPFELNLPVDWGSYELRVEGRGVLAMSSVGFAAGWYGAEDGTDTPDVLDVSLDAARYAPGDTAELRILPRQGGLALVQVMSDRLIDMQIHEIGDEETVISLPVTDDWGSGAYVTATLLRPFEGRSGQVPARALGLAHAEIDPGDRALNVALETPEVVRPRGSFEVALRVDGAAPGDTVFATIAAVDVGILNLTGFEAPDPSAHYFGQRRLGMAFRDVYGRLIDARDGSEGRIRQGGDASAGLRMQAPPPTEELVAEVSGLLVVGEDGRARAEFDMPAFNGTVRVMAVAWSATGVGEAMQDVLVRDPVVVQSSVPRFLAPGDGSRLLINVTHIEGPLGDVPFDITTSPGLQIGGALTAVRLDEDGDTAQLRVPLQAAADARAGVEEIEIVAALPDGQILRQVLTVPVMVNDPVVAETSRLTLAPGEQFTLDAAVLAGFRPGTGRATLAAGPLARFDAAGLLSMLDRYPYGCTEQVTSRAMPLLYLSSVAEAMDLGTAADLRARVEDAIDRILVNQSANGGFGLWRAYSGDLWLDAYATDFLSRARAEGFDVPSRAFRTALDNLANEVAAHPDFEDGGEGLAYALMVLAREGEASMGDLRYYADTRQDQFATPLALGQLGAALALYGDQPRADRLFRAGFTRLAAANPRGDSGTWRADYGSVTRDAAGLVALAAASGSNTHLEPAFDPLLGGPGERISTQEAVWTLLAAHALIENPNAQGLSLDGLPVNGPLIEAMRAGDTTTRTVTNAGTRPESLTLTRFGVPEGATEAFGNRYRIDRSYRTLEGQSVDPSTVPQGTRLVTLLTVTPLGAPEGRLMVNDPLPAGFEIDNPNLLVSGDVRAVQGLDLLATPEHTEFRQDRFLAAVDQRGERVIRLAYIVRAVSPGAFHHPAASVEDMYRPTYRAQTASGTVVVTEE